ncbi:MAG: ABC transporter substrate-binding protein, partial [Prevotella sp.]|nr:ABC transporter substrate-binding protein [Prevotella sp.]
IKDQRIRKQIDAFLKAYNAACDSLNGRGVGHYADILEKYCGVNQTTIQAMPKLKFPRAAAPREKDVETARKWLKN